MGNIPELRFLEFKKEWSRKRLQDIAKIARGKFTPRPRNDPRFYGGDIPFVQTSDVTNSKGYVSTYTQTLNAEGLKVSKFFPQGTILITIAANIGYCGILKIGMACPDSLIGISCNEDTYNKYLNSYLNYHQPRLDYLAPKAAQKNINIDFLNPYPILIPEIEEQQKIADFLLSVDNKISLLSEKQSLLQRYKKGVMQKLFSQELRFKDDQGNDFPDWEEKKFGDLFERVKRKNKENNKNVLTISAQQGLINQEKYFNKSVSAKDVTGYYLLNNGEFAYNKSYSKGYPMGAIKRLNRYEKGVVSTLYICFTTKDKISGSFYDQYFNAGLLNQEIQKIAQEGARNHGLLNISVIEFFSDIKVYLPHFEEQQKIANFLSEMDKKIDSVTKQIEQTKSFKKGLLQQMFV